MISLIRSYPYDNNYDYVRFFENEQKQEEYFNSFSSIDIEDNNYIRMNNKIQVGYNYDYLTTEGINYLYFNNGYKDIYAFIIEKNYLSSEVTELVFEVDVINTFMFDFSIKKSFVERKKCTLDEISDYDEGFYLGEHEIKQDIKCFDKESTYFVMMNDIKDVNMQFDDKGRVTNVTEINSTQEKPMTIIDGISYPIYFAPVNEESAKALCDHPSVVGILRVPSCTYTTRTIRVPYVIKNDEAYLQPGDPLYMSANRVTDVAETITPKSIQSNSISITKNDMTDFFPYTYYVLTDGECEPLIMHPQYLQNSLTVKGEYSISHQPVERFFPSYYKGDTTGRVYNITNTNQMMLPVASNEGLNYLNANCNTMKTNAQNSMLSLGMNELGAVISVLGAGASGGLSLLGGFSAVKGIASSYMQIKEQDARNTDMMLTPNSITSYGTPSTRKSFNTDSVRILKYSVSDKVKNKVLNFCERYGNKFNNYATINLRTYKGFIKFIAPDIDSSIDFLYLTKIHDILERGVYIE